MKRYSIMMISFGIWALTLKLILIDGLSNLTQVRLELNDQVPVPTPIVPTLQPITQSNQISLSWGIEVILIPIALALITILLSVLTHLYKESKQAITSALEAKIKADNAVISLQRIEDKLSALDSKFNDIAQKVSDLSSKSQTTEYLVDEFNKKLNSGHNALSANDQLSLNSDIESWDENKISRDEYVEKQQWYSWRKWVNRKSETGWQELLEYACQEGGLISSIRVMLETELERVQQKIATTSNPTQKDRDYEARLKELLDIDKTLTRTHP